MDSSSAGCPYQFLISFQAISLFLYFSSHSLWKWCLIWKSSYSFSMMISFPDNSDEIYSLPVIQKAKVFWMICAGKYLCAKTTASVRYPASSDFWSKGHLICRICSDCQLNSGFHPQQYSANVPRMIVCLISAVFADALSSYWSCSFW